MSVARYLRFLDQSNEERYGEVTDELVSKSIEGVEVLVLTGHPLEGFKATGGKAVVKKVGFPQQFQQFHTNLMTKGALSS